MSDLSLRLIISAVDNATKALERMAKQTEDINRRVDRSNTYWTAKDKREQEKHEHWKTRTKETEAQKRIRIAEKEARAIEREEDKRIRIAEKQERIAEKHARRQKQELMQTEQNFRTSAQRMALSTAVPATIMATLGMRSFMQMEERQGRMKMLYGEQSKDMEKFAEEYALNTAFTIQNTASLLEVMAFGKEKLGITTNEQIKDLSKIMGDVMLAYAPSAEAQTGVMENIQQMMSVGVLERADAKQMARWGLNIERLAKMVGVQKKGESWTAKEVVEVLRLARQTNEVQTKLAENAKTFTQAWGTAQESINLTSEGLGKTLNKQFDLTDNAKIFAGLLQKIAQQLKSDDANLTKGMASYLTMLALTVAPTLMVMGHWRKISFLIGESNMKGGVFLSRMQKVGGVMSGLYLATVDWGNVMKQYEEEGFLKTTLSNLDKVAAFMMVGGVLYQAIKGLYAFWIAKEIKLTATAAIRAGVAAAPVVAAAAAVAAPVVAAAAGVAATAGLGYLIYKKSHESSEKQNEQMGYDPLKRAFGIENKHYASRKNIEMLNNYAAPPKVEVINNIKIDKDKNVTVETKTKDKKTYKSPYSAPVMSTFSLGY